MSARDRSRRRLGNVFAFFGAVALLVGFLAPGRSAATDDLNGFNDKDYQVTTSRSYDANLDRTTFTFNLTGTANASHVLVVACADGVTVVSATGPGGAAPTTSQPARDGQGNGGTTGHTGLKWDPGQRGQYTVVYAGNVTVAEFVVKNGSGHKHFGDPTCEVAATSTSTTTTSTTTTTAPTTTTGPTTTTTTTAPTTTTTSTTTTSTTTTSTTTTTTAPTTTTSEPTTTTTTTGPTTTTTEQTDILGEVLTSSSTTTQPSSTTTTGPSSTSGPATSVAVEVEGIQVTAAPAPAAETAGTQLAATGASAVFEALRLAGLGMLLGGLILRIGPSRRRR